MVATRKSFGAPQNLPNEPRKRKSLETPCGYRKIYPDLTATASFASTTFEQTSEVQEDEEEYETDREGSFDTSRSFETPESDEKKAAWMYGLAAFAILMAILIGIIGKNSGKTDTDYEAYIKSVRSVIFTQFPDASAENRALLRLIGQKVFLEPDNHAPLVILVGGKQARQFSEAISQIVASTNSGEKYRKNRTIRVEAGTNRADFHKQLKEVLDASPTSQTVFPHTAVVLDVDLLQWDAVLVLHAFADHEKYPVPKTVLFLTVSEREPSDIENCDDRMVGFLTRQWIENGGSSDNIPPIIARISYFLCV
ncbi:unnamed protein product [Caenorhabditis sp. 36 PRJEB53466]|nr:unnamed protein product [Caenorhabditis sp. 36 PRJEB53466]